MYKPYTQVEKINQSEKKKSESRDSHSTMYTQWVICPILVKKLVLNEMLVWIELLSNPHNWSLDGCNSAKIKLLGKKMALQWASKVGSH